MDATEKLNSVPTLKEEGNKLFKVGHCTCSQRCGSGS
jgi:hypothetical protein